MGLYLFFRLVLCFLRENKKSFQLGFGSKPKKQSEPSTSENSLPYEGVYYLQQKPNTNMGRANAESRNFPPRKSRNLKI
jgi:hypothetical protein